ncbi:MAG: UDP-N-acetylmuramate dehydrogenase [Planctomycetes bacterium]|nr:UDP-N-acetylmuramate dehydrogenase [Planctomycetota bacterium]
MLWSERFTEILSDWRGLAELTTLGIGGAARYFLEPRSTAELAEVVAALGKAGVPVFWLGNGSKLLIDDAGVEGAVVSLRRLQGIRRGADPDGTEVEAEAGVRLPHLLAWTIRLGLAGLERCAGIPGTVGGALSKNAGGAHGSFGDVLVSATVVAPDGRVETRDSSLLGLGYRSSRLNGAVVAAVRLRLAPDEPRAISARARALMDHRKATQPLQDRTAGCIFVNPSGGRSAGRLLDEVGMKGRQRGRASISEKHANFVINQGGALAREVRDLIREGHDRVLGRFGVSLDLEIVEWPRPAVVCQGQLER